MQKTSNRSRPREFSPNRSREGSSWWRHEDHVEVAFSNHIQVPLTYPGLAVQVELATFEFIHQSDLYLPHQGRNKLFQVALDASSSVLAGVPAKRQRVRRLARGTGSCGGSRCQLAPVASALASLGSRVISQALRADMDEVAFIPFLQPFLALKRKHIGLPSAVREEPCVA